MFFCLNSGFNNILIQKGDILNLLSFVHYFLLLIFLLGKTIVLYGVAYFSLNQCVANVQGFSTVHHKVITCLSVFPFKEKNIQQKF